MNKFLVALPAVLGLAVAPFAHGADAKAQLQEIIGRVNNKVRASTDGTLNLSEELKALDALQAEHKDEKTADSVNILNAKVELELDLLRDYVRAAADLRTVQRDFPDSDFAKRANSMLPKIDQLAKAQEIDRSLAVGTQFPDFQVADLDGKPLSISGYKGKTVLVDFWATWCPPCVQDFPTVAGLASQYRDQGFQVIGVSLDEDKNKLTSFLQARQASWPEYFDGQKWQNKLAVAYGVTQTPTNYLLNKDGKIIAKNLHGEELTEAVKKAVSMN